MKKGKANQVIILFILTLLLTAGFASATLANSAEPPGLMVVVALAPKDLTLSIRFANGSATDAFAIALNKEQKAWETYYRFFYGMVTTKPSLKGATLVVQSSGNSFECVLPEETFDGYNNLITLNLADESVAVGTSLLRSVLLVSMRVVLTLIIEGLIFYVFEYRSAASWIAFTAVNLITQSMLNMTLSGPDISSYWMIGFVFAELLVIVVEIAVFMFILNEHRKRRVAA